MARKSSSDLFGLPIPRSPDLPISRHLAFMNPQLKGLESLEGTYLFDLERSARALRLNRFLHGLTVPEKRALFKESPDAAFERAGLTAEERRMVNALDWAALMRYGASFFCLEKLGRVKGVSNPEMVAGFRGETLDEFLKTRKVPGAR
jgi:gallate dioxygenase